MAFDKHLPRPDSVKYLYAHIFICLHSQAIKFYRNFLSICFSLCLAVIFTARDVVFSFPIHCGAGFIACQEISSRVHGLRKYSFPVIGIPCCDFLSSDVDCTGCCCQVFLTVASLNERERERERERHFLFFC